MYIYIYVLYMYIYICIHIYILIYTLFTIPQLHSGRSSDFGKVVV